MLAPVLALPPSGYSIDLAEAKAHLRVDHADDDAYIQALIEVATAHLDGWSGVLGRALLTQNWRESHCCFPGCDGRLRLSLLPVSAIVSITYYDTAGAQQTLGANVYSGPFVDELGAYVSLIDRQAWPATARREDAVAVTYSAGYGAAGDIPRPIRQAMLLLIGHWYAVREAVADAPKSAVPFAVDALIAPFRRIGI